MASSVRKFELDIVNHPEVNLTGIFGRLGSRCTPHNHSYISSGWSRMLIFPLKSLLLGWIRSFLVDEPLQLPLPDKGFNLLLQVVAVSCVMAMVTVEVTVFIPRSLVRISLRLARKG